MCECVDDRNVSAWQQRQVVLRAYVRRFDQANATGVDDNELRTLAQSTLHLRGKNRMTFGRVGANYHDDVGVHDAVKRLCAGRCTECLVQAKAGRRMTHSRAGIDIVIAHRRAHEFLYNEDFFVGAT